MINIYMCVYSLVNNEMNESNYRSSDLSGNICSKENRLSKITLYTSDQDSEQINSDLSGNICSNENRLL